MDLFLRDRHLQPDGCFGRLCQADGTQVAVTLEHAYPTAGGGLETKLAAGVYWVTKYLSPKRGYAVWLLHDVPGHDMIEIHIGNFNHDSDGCILVGSAVAPSEAGQMVTNSHRAFDQLWALQEGCNEWCLTVS